MVGREGRAMTDDTEQITIHRGLMGVYFDRSPTTRIDGRAGELSYRGYSIHDLFAIVGHGRPGGARHDRR